ncbi:molybdenum ABC transporter ATP-binding protein [Rhizobium sp. RU36D]|uniref:molybdenum ABC transporter ATP-binding protein n=1 Tax=Rhizobium sp. RU36D TaxID=1907415 RepID=UPI0009D882AF|nr:molybdenum ABC transporter ATP-binding protein [Rhizobium sp. RU36D]SMC91982.1 molybdate transport system ATP-binding protein [Rhizobium sp. RU36D]
MSLSLDIAHDLPSFELRADLDIGPGLTALFGPSGSGKTTLINLVAGLIRPDRGSILFDGEVWATVDGGVFVPPHRRRIGYVFQDGRLFPHMSVAGNLRYGQRFAPRGEKPDSFTRVVDLLGLGPLLDRRPAKLSGGEKQRVALGRALLASPRLLLMDEPLSALDNSLKSAILPYIERIRDEADVPILYVSHSIEEVSRLATRVISVQGGKVEALGAPDALLQSLPAIDGLNRAGSFLHARVTGQNKADGLTMAACRAGQVYLRHQDLPVGAEIRVFVPSGDIIVATEPVGAVSTLNRLSGKVVLMEQTGAGTMLHVDCAGDLLTAEVTRRSAEMLGLAQGREVVLLFKALSVGADSVLHRHLRS